MTKKASEFVKIAVFNDAVQAEILRGLLEAQNIRVLSTKEAIGTVYGFSVGAASEVELFVPGERAGEAQAIVKEYFAGAQPED